MIAETILGAFAAAAALYKAQAVYGVLYERRTARLRETREDFYAAAHTMLLNPAINERHLRYVRLTAQHVIEGDHARAHVRALRRLIHTPPRQFKDRSTPVVPAALAVDLGRLIHAAVHAIAERQPLWKFILLRTYRQALKRSERSPGEAVTAIEEAFGDYLPSAA